MDDNAKAFELHFKRENVPAVKSVDRATVTVSSYDAIQAIKQLVRARFDLVPKDKIDVGAVNDFGDYVVMITRDV